ncbi:protein cbp-1 [Folsomia candida]|uniref:histone acetyltransferase n=1 Tax=Folsomia candida TaxID=158441 RepID=A0A226DET9_FOLCA|nr:protein cbp-1 [Folsomia candida]XP_035714644.1 protein cbp-1 [Folsomia candida]OXA43689.1 CREB-binding protein [Folsomia candida]
MKPLGSPCLHKSNLKALIRPPATRELQSSRVHDLTASVSATVAPMPPRVAPQHPVSGGGTLSDQSVEQKRLLIRKQLVILLHAIVCRRRDLLNTTRDTSSSQPCNVPFCGLMKTVQLHLNSCKAGRTCPQTHCASSRQILIHWKYCVKAECPVCVSLRKVVPTSLLQIFPNPLCRAEIMQRIARQQQNASHSEEDDAVPELMESEE